MFVNDNIIVALELLPNRVLGVNYGIFIAQIRDVLGLGPSIDRMVDYRLYG